MGVVFALRLARSVHDPGKTVLDLAVAIALGGDCLADVGLVPAQPELFGAVASECLDEDGYLVLVDRAKDMIIRGGETI